MSLKEIKTLIIFIIIHRSHKLKQISHIRIRDEVIINVRASAILCPVSIRALFN